MMNYKVICTIVYALFITISLTQAQISNSFFSNSRPISDISSDSKFGSNKNVDSYLKMNGNTSTDIYKQANVDFGGGYDSSPFSNGAVNERTDNGGLFSNSGPIFRTPSGGSEGDEDDLNGGGGTTPGNVHNDAIIGDGISIIIILLALYAIKRRSRERRKKLTELTPSLNKN